MKTHSIILLAGVLAICTSAFAQTGTLADYQLLSQRERTMEETSLFHGCIHAIQNRFHTNGNIPLSDQRCERYFGLASSCEDLDEIPLEQCRAVFQGGLVTHAPEVNLDLDVLLEEIRNTVASENHYQGFMYTESETLAVTTYLRFMNTQYAVSQYISSSVQAELDDDGDPTGVYDTLYVTPGNTDWVVHPLPSLQNGEVIVVEGVCRLEGFVEGRITVLSADSMFVMDDLVTSDVILEEYGNREVYGLVPENSPNCIGLISESNVIIANTLPNGAFNGANSSDFCTSVMGPAWQGGPEMPANIQVENSSRQDVVITASIIALGCTFETEFWHTSATGIPLPETEGTGMGTPNPLCGGMNNSHVALWPCENASPTRDIRGAVWFCGSVTQALTGFLGRTPPGPLDPVSIGLEIVRRYDENLYHRAPPMWPISSLNLHYTRRLPDGLESGDHITPAKLYELASDTTAGIYLPTTLDHCLLPDHYRLLLNHCMCCDSVPVVQQPHEIVLDDASIAVLLPFPRVDCTTFALPGDTISPVLGVTAWNRNGSDCSWVLTTGDLQLAPASMDVECGEQPFFDEFVQRWNAADQLFRVVESPEVVHTVRLVNEDGNILAESSEGTVLFALPELETGVYFDYQSYKIHVEVLGPWSGSGWTSLDEHTWWHNDAPEFEWTQAPPACGQVTSREAFLANWNSAPPVIHLFDQNHDSIHVQLQNQGITLRAWSLAATHIPTTLELSNLAPADLPGEAFELSLHIHDRLGFAPEGYEPLVWWYNPDTAVSPAELPQELSLRAFPNPFNPRTTIELALPVAGEVRVELFDLAGRSASVIRRGEMAAGLYHIPVDGQNLASGLYLLRVEAPDAAGQRQQRVQKLLLVK